MDGEPKQTSKDNVGAGLASVFLASITSFFLSLFLVWVTGISWWWTLVVYPILGVGLTVLFAAVLARKP